MALPTDWQAFIAAEQQAPYFQQLSKFVAAERAAGKAIFPPEDEVFSAFELTPLDKVRVVLIGQDLTMAQVRLMACVSRLNLG